MTTNKITIRKPRLGRNIEDIIKADKNDWTIIQKLLWELYNHECQHRGITNDRSPNSMLCEMDYILNQNITNLIVIDGEIAGMFMESNNTFYNLVIRKKYRRKGIVRHIFDDLYGDKTIRLQVRESNQVALDTYEALGFEVEEDWYNFYEMVRYGGNK